MHKIADFFKVSYEQFNSDIRKDLLFFESAEDEIKEIYNRIKLPERSTSGSAGYDIRTPFGFVLKPGQTILVPTGIRCRIDNGWFFMIVPRSGLGFKYRLQLDNTTGIIDSDYFNAENEGHIMAKITNDSKSEKVLKVNDNDRIVQGIFVPYGITCYDSADGDRIGGFGSSGVL